MKWNTACKPTGRRKTWRTSARKEQGSATDRALTPRRWRRQQRVSSALVESGTADAGRRDGARHRGEPLSSRNQQMEQDRTSAVLLHQQELARATAHKSEGDREPDCWNHNAERVEGP